MRRRLFLARKSSGRRDYNQDEIFTVCQRHGFEKIYMEDMPLQEQIEAIRSAELIAGPTGAAWTNLIFVEPGTRCLCWMAEEQRGFAAYSNLAHAVGAELRYVTYATGVRDSDRLYFINYRLDPAEVERGLTDLV
jgi:capsular polysaccharide biosynthesis protein